MVDFLGYCETNVPKTNYAERIPPRIVRSGRERVMSFLEFVLVQGASGEVRKGHVTENRDNVVEGHVGDGLGGGSSSVAVEDS